jgi:phenylpropionate dioxygenase-like ring-hydroxylating dioxygenase large terminal subunit
MSAGRSEPVAVALSRDVPSSTSIGVRVDGIEYVVWRDANGSAHIWEDRCPHRGMKLSLGFVRGDRIACLYHGWEYGTDGVCQKIPAHPDLPVPDSITVGTFGVVERGGLIWLAAEASDIEVAPLHPVRSMMVEADVKDVEAPEGIHVFLQPVSAGQTMLHIGVVDTAQAEPAFFWSLSLRTELESTA